MNVVVGRKRNIRVASNATAGIINTNQTVVLKNTPTLISGGTSRLDHLQDVDASAEVQGATLVYDSATDKYVTEKLNLSNTVGNLDGGQF